jgi:hypothetical protein
MEGGAALLKQVNKWMIKSRIKSLDKVIRNAEKSGWPNVELEARQAKNRQRMKLSELE